LTERGYGRPVLLDNSAWSRIINGQLSAPDRTRWESALDADEIVVCDPFRLEALYSARTARDYEELREELAALRQAPSDAETWQLALDAQAELAAARRVSHRVKIVDLLVAAAAAQHDLGVLHYDQDFDLVAEHSGLRYDSIWIADRGTLP
jgi:predicted nucleic acid-binding protein